MFKNKLTKSLEKVNGFIQELKDGIGSNESKIDSNKESINLIQEDSNQLQDENKQARRLLTVLHG
ncbi:MAG: hypothetical protein GQ570_08445 [Helicobacteraceae bacterium]|nr:hypothetical protein [Helicobacteraceae bacterium]